MSGANLGMNPGVPGKVDTPRFSSTPLSVPQDGNSTGLGAEGFLQSFVKQATEGPALLGMIGGGLTFRLTRFAALNKLFRNPLSATLTQVWGRKTLANVMALGVEAAAFTGTIKGTQRLLGHEADSSWATWKKEMGGAALVLGSLRFFGWSTGLMGRGLNRLAPFGAGHQAALGQLGMYSGILFAHRSEEALGLRPESSANPWSEALATLAQFNVAGLMVKRLSPKGLHAWEQRLDQSAELLVQQRILGARILADKVGKILFPGASPAFAGSAMGAGAPKRMPGVFKMEGKEADYANGGGNGAPAPLSEIRASSHAEFPSTPEGPLILTYPQTAERIKPKFRFLGSEQELKEAQGSGRSEGKPLDSAVFVQHLLTKDSGLNPADGHYYTRFVMDRLAEFPGVLKHFSLPKEIKTLEDALSWFTDRFCDESPSGLLAVFQEAKVAPDDQNRDVPLGYRMLTLMRTAKSDAADYLTRLNQLDIMSDPAFKAYAQRIDPSRLNPEAAYSLKYWQELQPQFPELSEAVFLDAYRHMLLNRVLTQTIYNHYKNDEFSFAVTDAGHEIQGTAAAMAMFHEVNPEAFAISPHYRSGTVVGEWANLRGHPEFLADYIRQQLSKITDKWSKGRQTASHFNDIKYNILPGQSEVGRNLSKAVGYARALQMEGHKDAVVYAELGDGSLALSDLHEAMTGATLMGYKTQSLPVVIGVVDNGMAISVEPSSGRALADMASYAKAFGADFYTCDGNDFLDVYQTYRVAFAKAKERQKPAMIWVQGLARLNNHSAAAAYNFDYQQHDPLLDYALSLYHEGLIKKEQVVWRPPEVRPGANFFHTYHLGELGERARKKVDETWEKVAQEPDPTLAETLEDVHPPFPEAVEPALTGRPTKVIINGAIRAALRDIIEENPKKTLVAGQDTGKKGGVFQATAGLWELFPDNVLDTFINEPGIMGILLGFALRKGNIAFPEIQFGDYALSGLHWMVNAGGLHWTSGGTQEINWNVRLPVEPGIYGAVYHSTPLEGLLAAIPGMVIVAPSTTRDAYGLMRSAAEYWGPVSFFEPKMLYRMALGDAFPNEPSDPQEAGELYKDISLRRGIPDLPKDFRVPLGKAAVRREGKDLTLVTWGLSHYYAQQALGEMVAQGIDVELIDLRTIVPPDMETVLKSVGKTGRLLVVHQDRVFASLGREIQGQVHEALPGQPIYTKVLGMEPTPGIAQARAMEDAIMVKEEKIIKAAGELMKL